MARKRSARSADELRNASKHPAYEIDMFCQQGEEFERLNTQKHGKSSASHGGNKDPKPKQIVLNGLREAFYVHARNLLGFVYNCGRQDEIRARDYHGQWKPSMPQDLRQLCSYVNKMIMHLTYDRVRLYELTRKWPVKSLIERLARPLVDFYDVVQETNPALFLSAVETAIKKCRRHVV